MPAFLKAITFAVNVLRVMIKRNGIVVTRFVVCVTQFTAGIHLTGNIVTIAIVISKVKFAMKCTKKKQKLGNQYANCITDAKIVFKQ